MDDTAMVLLHRGLWDNGDMASTLLFPKWGHYGQIGGLLADYRNNTSVDIYQNRFVRLGGTSWSDNDILHYNLDKRYVSSSCYSARPTFFSEVLKIKGQPDITHLYPDLKYTYPNILLWTSFSMTRTSITKNSSCETKVYSR